ncbi:hypothetical protein RB601_002575 [Gaeumannomyces tritici]
MHLIGLTLRWVSMFYVLNMACYLARSDGTMPPPLTKTAYIPPQLLFSPPPSPSPLISTHPRHPTHHYSSGRISRTLLIFAKYCQYSVHTTSLPVSLSITSHPSHRCLWPTRRRSVWWRKKPPQQHYIQHTKELWNMGSRRHSVSGDHHHRHHRSHPDDYGYDRDNAHASRDEGSPRHRHRYEDHDSGAYAPRRAASRLTRTSSTRRHSPDSRHHQDGGTRGRRHHDDDDYYDPRDRYYLSGEESDGWRSRSQPRPSAHHTREGDDYFGSQHRRSQSRREPSRRSSPRRSSHSRHHRHDDDKDRDSHQEPRGRRGAPPMPRRQSSSAPPPSSRKYPPSSSHNRHSRHGGSSSASKYPPNSADNRKRTRSMSFGGGSKHKDKNADGGRRRSGSRSGDGGAFGDIPWSAAVRCAVEAGTMAALKAKDHPGQWIGTKGAQVATAAVGAALVDGFIANRNPGIRGGKRHAVLRQVTNAALSNLVMNPVGKTAEEKKPQMHDAGRNFARHMGSPIHRHRR